MFFRIVELRTFMGVRVLSALLVATPLFNSSPCPSVLTALVQLASAPKGYGDRGEIWAVAGGKDYAGKPVPLSLFKTTVST
jgi:hypothetical protein